MPIQPLKTPKFVAPRLLTVSWDSWRKGLNTLLRETEIDGMELSQADNLLLVGSGVPTKRWGSANAFLAGATGYGRFLFVSKDTSDNYQVLAMTDWGILTKQNNASYTVITGASFGSGYNIEAAQLDNKVYLTNGNRPWVRYDFTSLINFPSLVAPTGVAVTNFSGATGTTTWSWRITTLSKSGGETLGSTAISLATLPLFLNQTMVRVTWTPTSAASGDMNGYNIYRGPVGSEIWVGGTDVNTTRFDDFGTASTQPFRTVPISDTSAGPTAKYIMRFQDRLILAGIPGDPTRVIISGRWPNHERFDWFNGGGFILIEPSSGENITGLGSYFNADAGIQTIVVFKERSVWELRLNTVALGQYVILDPQYRLLTLSQGAASHRSITPVENDLYFVNKRGIYILRYEPQLLNVINANELSAKIRPFFENLSYSDIQNSSGIYVDKKFLVSFPTAKKTIMFDRERLSFMGPWPTPFGINKWASYIDSDGMEHWLAIDADDQYVSEFRKTYIDDKGTAMRTTFKTKKEYFGDWTLFKTITTQFMNFRNVSGTISMNIYLEQRNGATIVAKSISITGTSTGKSGFGTDGFGLSGFGISTNNPSIATTEDPKKTFLFQQARTIQIEIITTDNADSYELLGLKTLAIPQSSQSQPSGWIV